MNAPAARQRTEAVGRDIVTGQHGLDARQRQCGRLVDAADRRMAMRRSDEHAERHVGPLDVGDVIAAAGQKAEVFLAARCSANSDHVRHGYSPTSRRMHGGRTGQHRRHDVLIAGAAADIALEAVANLGFGGRRIFRRQRHRCHHHARGAEAALQAVILMKRFLHRMQRVRTARPRQAFDRRQRAPVEHRREQGAALHRLAVEQHDAGAALAGIAPDMGPCQVEVLAQQIGDQRRWLDVNRPRPAVERETDYHG